MLAPSHGLDLLESLDARANYTRVSSEYYEMVLQTCEFSYASAMNQVNTTHLPQYTLAAQIKVS